MLLLPPGMRLPGWRTSIRLPFDHCPRVASNEYSVDPVAIGRRVDVHADLDTVRSGGVMVSSGPISGIGDGIKRSVTRSF
jgi:hypothetical protein